MRINVIIGLVWTITAPERDYIAYIGFKCAYGPGNDDPEGLPEVNRSNR